jgi:hypothetical protein
MNLFVTLNLETFKNILCIPIVCKYFIFGNNKEKYQSHIRNENSSTICRFCLTFDNAWVRSIKIRKVLIEITRESAPSCLTWDFLHYLEYNNSKTHLPLNFVFKIF